MKSECEYYGKKYILFQNEFLCGKYMRKKSVNLKIFVNKLSMIYFNDDCVDFLEALEVFWKSDIKKRAED